jgi:D-aminoacyl-tRNA deacylase
VRVLLQRVSRASVSVDGEIVGAIGSGLLLLVGIGHADRDAEVSFVVQKIANLRIFSDEKGRMNLSLIDIDAELLIVSQFTLYANVRKGRRPSFLDAAAPEEATPLLDSLVVEFRQLGINVEQGRFGTHMDVELVNDGPVTIWLDTADFLD